MHRWIPRGFVPLRSHFSCRPRPSSWIPDSHLRNWPTSFPRGGSFWWVLQRYRPPRETSPLDGGVPIAQTSGESQRWKCRRLLGSWSSLSVFLWDGGVSVGVVVWSIRSGLIPPPNRGGRSGPDFYRESVSTWPINRPRPRNNLGPTIYYDLPWVSGHPR